MTDDALRIAHLNESLLRVMRETQLEHGRRLDELQGKVSELIGSVSRLTGDASGCQGIVSELRSGQNVILGLVQELIRRDDERRTDSDGVSD